MNKMCQLLRLITFAYCVYYSYTCTHHSHDFAKFYNIHNLSRKFSIINPRHTVCEGYGSHSVCECVCVYVCLCVCVTVCLLGTMLTAAYFTFVEIQVSLGFYAMK